MFKIRSLGLFQPSYTNLEVCLFIVSAQGWM